MVSQLRAIDRTDYFNKRHETLHCVTEKVQDGERTSSGGHVFSEQSGALVPSQKSIALKLDHDFGYNSLVVSAASPLGDRVAYAWHTHMLDVVSPPFYEPIAGVAVVRALRGLAEAVELI